jgi:spermidine dehydrogenase
MTPEARKDRLSRISYLEWLTKHLSMHPLVVAALKDSTRGEWTCGIDAVSALDCWGFGFPGFAGLEIPDGPYRRMSFTPAGYVVGGSKTFHFPDGNASIARLLVRALVPEALSGKDAVDIVTARADYSRLDRPQNQVRIRLSSPVLKAVHSGPVGQAPSVDITYARFGKLYGVRARKVVMASWNMMIPYIVEGLPETQKAALHDLVKDPLVYISVGIDRWTAFEKAGCNFIDAPGSYCNHVFLNQKVAMGGYEGPTTPDRPNIVHMNRTPCAPGLSEHDQARAGRAELLATDFATFEREIRSQLGRMLGPSGFDPARDISAIVVNRWPHGYAPERNYLWEEELPADKLPQVVGRQRFGRIAIANSDCGGGAYTDVAIDMARRAVDDLA